ncbi:CLUMA_CG017020, isoform A [Clunio marinus]|uniref:CLUMA_CG017020, isoform A n=1 Tax=Clunio marinus TaxID=568069 RepID=A0A1J1IW21_9DIPT|nr:CLUMA_CG017020, isoform A [Clunio marinus]
MLDKGTFLTKTLIIGSVILIFGIKGSTALMCYHCNSAYDPRCEDPFNSFSIATVNCSTLPLPEKTDPNGNAYEYTLCRKTSQKVYGKVRVVRDCGYLHDGREDKDCVKRSGTHDVYALYCACTSDLCNVSPKIAHQWELLSASLLISLIYFVNQQLRRN